MNTEKIEGLRVEAVNLLDAAGWNIDPIVIPADLFVVLDSISEVGTYLEGENVATKPRDVAALHALALLLAAMTEAT